MVAREAFHQHGGELALAVEENAVVRNEDVVEDDQGLHAAESGIAAVQSAVLQLAGIAALSADDHENALRVDGHGKGDGVIGILRLHGLGGHDEDLVGIRRAGLVSLGSPDHHAVRTALHDPQEQVAVGLGVRREAPVTLGISHGAVHGEVLLLDVFHVLFEIIEIVRAVNLVHLIGRGPDGVEGVHAHAALEAGCGLLAAEALHLHLEHQVLGALVDVAEAVDLPAGDAARGGHKRLVLGHLGQIIGHLDGVHRGAQDGIVHRAGDLLAEHIDTGMQLAQALEILFAGH